jgi:hypothetical protein
MAKLLMEEFAPSKFVDMGIPGKVPVAFKVMMGGDYHLTFILDGPQSAADFRPEITEVAILTPSMRDSLMFSLMGAEDVDVAIGGFYAIGMTTRRSTANEQVYGEEGLLCGRVRAVADGVQEVEDAVQCGVRQ